MDLRLAAKVIVVTGGGSGIGAGITEVLAEEGATPVVLARRTPDADWLARTGADFVTVELADDAACRAAIETVRRRHPAIHGLVNNAGANDGVGLDKGPDAFRASLNANLVHYYTMVHLLAGDLRRTKGAIVNIASKTALTGQGGTSAYVAAKAAELGLTREWAVEFLPDEVRVNAIVVAEVMTPLYRRWLDTLGDPDEALRRINARIPLGRRMTTAREIADTCAFLLSGRNPDTRRANGYSRTAATPTSIGRSDNRAREGSGPRTSGRGARVAAGGGGADKDDGSAGLLAHPDAATGLIEASGDIDDFRPCRPRALERDRRLSGDDVVAAQDLEVVVRHRTPPVRGPPSDNHAPLGRAVRVFMTKLVAHFEMVG